MNVTVAALELAALKLPVFACRTDKSPVAKGGFQTATLDPHLIRTAFASKSATMIGVPTGAVSGFDVLDIDPRHGGDVWLNENKHRMRQTRVHGTPSGGYHWLLQHAAGMRNSAGRVAPGVDVRGDGGYAIFPPSPGYTVEFPNQTLAEWDGWLLELATKLPPPLRPPNPEPQLQTALLERRVQGYVNKLLVKVWQAPEGQKHDALLRNARALGGIMDGAGISEADAVAWLLAALPDTVADWSRARNTIADGLAHGRASPLVLEERRPTGRSPPPPPPPRPPEPPPPSPPAFHGFALNEDGIALAFTARHGDQLRFDHHAGAWFQWTGHAWRKEEKKLAFSWARRECRDLALGEADPMKKVLARAATAAAVERYAQADEAFAVTSEIWDTDTFLLGTPGGTVDLRTTEMREARQADYITKLTAVGPAAWPDCPVWLGFLDQATASDAELIRFLRQWCGYCLTGDTREQALLFGYGPGGNGKSVFLNTIAAIMGDYARTAAMDTFVATPGDRHSTDLAMLRGARMVCASETEEGRAWAETRIKQLTGGDRISARFMRQDFFEFTPQFKLTIIGNHKPVLRSVDEAARRRFNVVPFLNTPDQADKLLEVKLRAEWPGILRWMIEGCLDWQMNGLVRPAVVTDATNEYFEAQDYFARWLTDCCNVVPTMRTRPSHLIHSFQEWCQANGEPQPDSKRLRGMIERMPGLRYIANGGVQWIRGIGLKPSTSEPFNGGV